MKRTLEPNALTRSERRFAAVFLVALATLVAFCVVQQSNLSSRAHGGLSTGTFSTEKLKITGTGSDSYLGSGGVQIATTGAWNTIDASRTATGSTSADSGTIYATSSGTYDTTAQSLFTYGVRGASLSSRSAGANTLNGYGVFGFAKNAQTNVGVIGNVVNSSPGVATNDIAVLGVSDGIGTNAYALRGIARGAATTNYGAYATASGASTNYSGYFDQGLFHVVGAATFDSTGSFGGALDMTNHLVNNVTDPVSAQDAATKNYVDTHSGFISGLTTGVIPKATSATSIGDSKLSETAGPFLDWNSATPSISGTGLFTIGPTGTVVLGSSGGLPSTEITLNAVTGDITSNNGSLTVLGGVTADAGKRVFDVAGAGLTSSTNTVNVATTLGSGITVNADSIQMTFCAANQVPQMNAGGTAWTCAAAASGTIGGSATSPGVIYASGANTAATDATNFTYDATNKGIRVGSSAVTNASANDAVVVSGGGASSAAMSFWNTSASGYSQIYWSDSSITYKGALGYANASAGSTNLRQKNFFVSNGPDFVFNEAAGGTNLLTVFMTSGSAGMQFANGSSAAAGSSGTGKIIYNNTTKTFRVSQDGGSFTSIVTGAVALNTIPKSSNGTTGALADSLLTDNGTTFAINTNKFTVTEASGNTSIAGTLGVTGDVAINTNKFTVAATTGNTLVAGTLGVTSDVAINTNKYTITASTGSAVSAGSETAALGFFDNGTAPTISSCGSSPTVTSGRGSFTITAGTGSVASCTATFSTAFSSTPTCTATVVNSGTNQFVRFSALSSSALTVTSTFFLDSIPINIICIGH